MSVHAEVSREGARSGPRLHLHLSGLALLAATLVAYAASGANWWLFALLIFAPDLFMLGYLFGTRAGAVVYNVGHSLLWPALLVGIALVAPAAPGAGLLSGAPTLQSVGIIWAAHIGMDWTFGYGYKYPTRFQDTHFQRV